MGFRRQSFHHRKAVASLKQCHATLLGGGVKARVVWYADIETVESLVEAATAHQPVVPLEPHSCRQAGAPQYELSVAGRSAVASATGAPAGEVRVRMMLSIPSQSPYNGSGSTSKPIPAGLKGALPIPTWRCVQSTHPHQTGQNQAPSRLVRAGTGIATRGRSGYTGLG